MIEPKSTTVVEPEPPATEATGMEIDTPAVSSQDGVESQIITKVGPQDNEEDDLFADKGVIESSGISPPRY